MPRWKKRKYYADEDVPDESEETERNTKCSLSSICHTGKRDVRPFLSEATEYCNKLRVLVSIVAKHHIFATLKEQGENATRQDILPLPFKPNQDYSSRVRTMAVDGILRRRKGWGIAKLRGFVATVQGRSSGKYPLSSLQWTTSWNDTISDDDVHAEATCGEPDNTRENARRRLCQELAQQPASG